MKIFGIITQEFDNEKFKKSVALLKRRPDEQIKFYRLIKKLIIIIIHRKEEEPILDVFEIKKNGSG